MLAGCCDTKIIYKDKFMLVDIPVVYLSQCSVNKPPARVDYIGLDYRSKEEVLTDYSMSLLSDLSACNIQQTGLNNWYIEQKKIYPSGNK